MIIFKWSCFLIMLTVTISCNHETKSEIEVSKMSMTAFNALLNEHDVDFIDFENILIIPGVGCSGCISQAQLFFNENKYKQDHLFVFTGIDDLKMFKLQVADSLWQQNNVIVDEHNKVMLLGYDSIYPSYVRAGGNQELFLEPFIIIE